MYTVLSVTRATRGSYTITIARDGAAWYTITRSCDGMLAACIYARSLVAFFARDMQHVGSLGLSSSRAAN